jgi:hypothetical protein
MYDGLNLNILTAQLLTPFGCSTVGQTVSSLKMFFFNVYKKIKNKKDLEYLYVIDQCVIYKCNYKIIIHPTEPRTVTCDELTSIAYVLLRTSCTINS